MAKKKQKVLEYGDKHAMGAERLEVAIPDEAVYFIVSKYMSTKIVDGVPAAIGISSDDVESVIGLFIEWAASKGYVKDGILFIGGNPIG